MGMNHIERRNLLAQGAMDSRNEVVVAESLGWRPAGKQTPEGIQHRKIPDLDPLHDLRFTNRNIERLGQVPVGGEDGNGMPSTNQSFRHRADGMDRSADLVGWLVAVNAKQNAH